MPTPLTKVLHHRKIKRTRRRKRSKRIDAHPERVERVQRRRYPVVCRRDADEVWHDGFSLETSRGWLRLKVTQVGGGADKVVSQGDHSCISPSLLYLYLRYPVCQTNVFVFYRQRDSSPVLTPSLYELSRITLARTNQVLIPVLITPSSHHKLNSNRCLRLI